MEYLAPNQQVTELRQEYSSRKIEEQHRQVIETKADDGQRDFIKLHSNNIKYPTFDSESNFNLRENSHHVSEFLQHKVGDDVERSSRNKHENTVNSMVQTANLPADKQGTFNEQSDDVNKYPIIQETGPSLDKPDILKTEVTTSQQEIKKKVLEKLKHEKVKKTGSAGVSPKDEEESINEIIVKVEMKKFQNLI